MIVDVQSKKHTYFIIPSPEALFDWFLKLDGILLLVKFSGIMQDIKRRV
jgi:hypothetical protein